MAQSRISISRQDHRRRHHRPGQRPAPDLVDPADDAGKGAFELEMGHAGLGHGGRIKVEGARVKMRSGQT
jgi:hypothetical protein